jgi:hypothetical protein
MKQPSLPRTSRNAIHDPVGGLHFPPCNGKGWQKSRRFTRGSHIKIFERWRSEPAHGLT